MADVEALAESVIQNSFEADIEEAQDAGDDERANALYRKSMGVDAEADDADPDADTGADDVDALADDGTPPPVSTEVVDQILVTYGDVDEAEMAELQAEWPGNEMAANLGYVKWFLNEYVPPHLIDQVPDDVFLLRIGAAVGRELFHRHHANAGERSEGAINMSETAADNFDETTDDLMTQEEQARSEGNLGKASRLQREIRALFVKRYGTAPAVGSSGGPTV